MKVMQIVYVAVCANAVAFASVVSDTKPAKAQEFPWCLVDMSGSGDGGTYCQYSTLAQCNASRAGGGQICVRNPDATSRARRGGYDSRDR